MENQEDTSGVLFIGCMFLGMGLGYIFDQTGAGMFIGMGVGFIASAFYKKEKANKK
jgi:hypothetical protein